MKRIISFYIMILSFIFNNAYSQNLTPEEIFEKVNSSIVIVESYGIKGEIVGQGSGVIISEKGMIFTNYHNFANADTLLIKHNDNYITYNQVIGVDIDKDILILSTDYKTESSIQIANINELKVGNKVYAIGSPLGYENSLSDGIIAGLRRTLREIGKSNLIQITATIDHGSSGGAVLNSRGELIGISSFGDYDSYGNKSAIYFAIPVSDILSLNVVANGDRAMECKIYYAKAKIFKSENKYTESIHFFTKCISHDNSDIKSYLGRGYCYLYLDNFNAAKNDFDKALQIDNSIVDPHNALGDYYFSINNFEKSELEFRRSLQIDSNDSYAIFRRGDVYLRLKNYIIAIREYKKALEITPNNLLILTQRSLAYFLNDDFENAFSDINFVIMNDPQNRYARILKEQYIHSKELKDKEQKLFYKLLTDFVVSLGKIIIIEAINK